MAKEYADKFYHSKAWKDCKRSFISDRVAIDGGMCQVCHENLGYIVHHRVHITADNISDPDITLNHNKKEQLDVLLYMHRIARKREVVLWGSRKNLRSMN